MTHGKKVSPWLRRLRAQSISLSGACQEVVLFPKALLRDLVEAEWSPQITLEVLFHKIRLSPQVGYSRGREKRRHSPSNIAITRIERKMGSEGRSHL